LLSELAALKPDLKVVIALGSVATKALLDTRKGVTWMRGRILEYPGLDCDFAATYHPAATLAHRDPNLYPDLVFDLKRVVAHLNGKGPQKVACEYFWARSEDAALALIEACQQAKYFSIDLETDSAERPDFQTDKVIQVNLGWAPGKAGVIRWKYFSDAVLDGFRDLFTNPDYFRVLFNGKFDAKMGYALTGEIIKVNFDGMLAHLMFDERRGIHALWYVAPHYVGIDTWEHLIQPYLPNKKVPFSNVPPRVLAQYGARDADCEYRLGPHFQEELKGKSYEHLYYNILLPAAEAVTRAELNGIKVDVEYARNLQTGLKQRIDKAEKNLSRDGSVNIRSPKQLAVVLYDELQLPIDPEEGRTTRKDVLEKLRHQSDYVEQLLDFKEADKLHGTYLKKLIAKAVENEANLVYMDYQLHGTVTGRWSETGARVMTIPRESWMRRIFVAREGMEFLRLDYSGAEVCWTAVYSKDPDLTRIINSGRHIHTEVAMEMFRHTPESWAKLSEDVKTDLKIKSKSVVFGLLYGRGQNSLAEQFGVTPSQAKAWIDKFFSQFPGVRDWMGRTQWEAVTRRELTTVYGRKRRFGIVTEDTKHMVKRQGVNFLPSSSSNEMTMSTYVRVWQRLGLAGPVYLHDGIVWEVPDGQAKKLASAVREIAEEIDVETDVKFRVDLAHGHSWGDLKEVAL
jgi:DNA polymerase-1